MIVECFVYFIFPTTLRIKCSSSNRTDFENPNTSLQPPRKPPDKFECWLLNVQCLIDCWMSMRVIWWCFGIECRLFHSAHSLSCCQIAQSLKPARKIRQIRMKKIFEWNENSKTEMNLTMKRRTIGEVRLAKEPVSQHRYSMIKFRGRAMKNEEQPYNLSAGADCI